MSTEFHPQSPPPPNLSSKSKIAKQLAAVLAGCLLIWLSFRGANISKVMSYVRCANISFIGLMCLSALLSHFLRAWRWLILLKPLTKTKISLWHSFCAVIYGYAVNIIVPRGGEIIRLLAICKSESLPWAGVLPTLLIDRLLDLIVLVFLLGFTLISLPPDQLASLPWLYPSGISLSLATLILFLALPRLGAIISFLLDQDWLKKLIPTGLMDKIKNLLAQFDQGTRSLTSPLAYPLIILSTLAIWFCYWLNFYFVISAFGLDRLISLNKGLIVFSLGSLSSLVPTPGCVGGFHFLVSKCLVLIAGVDQNLALSFATVLHAFAFVIVVSVAAGVCLLVENWRR